MQLVSQKARLRVVAAESTMLLDQPFYGGLALHLDLKEDPTCFPPTAWTDGVTLGYHPAFVESLPMQELVALVVHEVEHCARGHQFRRGTRDPEGWNEACDYEINVDLVEAGYKLPEGGLYDPAYKGKSAEWIYARRSKPKQPRGGGRTPRGGTPGGPPQNGDGDGEDRGGDGGQGDTDDQHGKGRGQGPHNPQGVIRDAPKVTGESDKPAPTKADWDRWVGESEMIAKGRGKFPANLAQIAAANRQPRVDCWSVLQRFVAERAADDYSWRQPNRRYLPQGLYLPALHNEQMGPIAIGLDSSGSVFDGITLAVFEANVRTVIDQYRPRRVVVIYCDAAVNHVDEFERGEDFKLTVRGGGGTDFRPVFKHIETLDEQPVCLIYLTDLDGTFPHEAPDYPVLWGSVTKDSKAPFGETVYIDE